MKVKTSVTLSEKLLAAIDEVAGEGCNRSAILEEAATDWVRRKRREERSARDVAIYARMAADPEIQRESEENLKFQPHWTDFGDEIELTDEVRARLDAEVGARAKG
ncbi:MAG: ribbon-helix-helix protein, CopG family [Dehalococcoidia bacterium]